MVLNFGNQSLFNTSASVDVGFRTVTEIEGVRREEQDIIPVLSPGEIVLWEKGQGQGEFFLTNDDATFAPFGVKWGAQTFTLGNTAPDGDFTIAKVSMWMYRLGTPGTVTFSIRATDGDGKPTGADLISGTTNGNTLTTDSAGELREITFTTITLKATTNYALVIRATSGDINNRPFFKGDNSGGYDGGNFIQDNDDSGASWDVLRAEDIYFDFQGAGKFLLVETADGETYQATLTKIP